MSSCPGTEAPGTVNTVIKLHLSKGAQGTNSPSRLLSHQNGSLLMCTYGSRQNKTSQCSLRSTRKAEIVGGFSYHLEYLQSELEMGTKPNDKRVPPARLFLPCSHAGTTEVMPSRGHRGSPWPVIPFSCACKETQPNPSRNTALSDQINARRSWQRHRRPPPPCLHKQEREFGNLSAGFVPTAADGEPCFACQLPRGPTWGRGEPTLPALQQQLLLPQEGWEMGLGMGFSCNLGLCNKEREIWEEGG